MIAFRELDDAHRSRLLAASSRHFGLGSYQADSGYLHWLYERNPASHGMRDCIVATQGEAVVGCMHRLMLPMNGGRRLAALHNHFVDPSIRSGSGVLLLRRSTRDADVAVAPGVEEKLGPIYQRLRFHAVDGAWLQKPLSYLSIATGVVGGKLGIAGSLTVREPRATRGSIVTATPTVAQIAELSRAMRPREGEDGVDWSDDLVRWRFFDPRGPRHLLVRSASSSAWAVMALGRRKGVRTMRLMAFSCDDSPDWMASVERVARRAGAALGLAFTTDPVTRDALRASGWSARTAMTHTFATAPLVSLSAASTDLGFEAFGTEIA